MKAYLLSLTLAKAAILPMQTNASPSTSSIHNFVSLQDVNLYKKFDSINIKLKLPPNAKITKNDNGNAEVDLGNHSILTIAQIAVFDMDEAMTTANDYYLHDDSYINAKKVVDDTNGFVYTRQLKTEEYGYRYAPESHFDYFFTR